VLRPLVATWPRRIALAALVGGGVAVALTLALAGSPSPAPAATPSPLPGARLLVPSDNPAEWWANRLRRSRPADARLLDRIASQPVALWPSEQHARIVAREAARQARRSGTVPVLVAYDIPKLDCHNAGAPTAARYRRYISDLAAGLGRQPAAIVLEPDALAAMDCLSPADRRQRTSLMSWAVNVFNARTRAAVYIDGGNPVWKPASTMAGRLKAAGVRRARGFSVNVSNFVETDRSIRFAHAIASKVGGGARAVIDVGRNGNGPGSTPCNPGGRALGQPPTTRTGDPIVDALLWIKPPGQSDGTCNGGPAGGVFWVDYALGLARRARGAG
jgi:endoglucanase